MYQKSRTKITLINTTASLFTQVIKLLLTFLTRAVFLHFLSVDYLGINGLYTNVLSVLSLAELGIGNVMVFSLYKPVANKDKDTINELLNFYNKLYLIIAIVILILGIILIPFLPLIIDSGHSNKELVLYYILFLTNSVFTYFVAHKRALIQANQQTYIIKKVELIVLIGRILFQILVLVLFKNYIVYLLVQIISTLIENIYLSYTANIEYPYIKTKIKADKKIDKKPIIENIKATFLYKIGTTVINSTDDIIVSVLFGTATLGYYSNYELIVAGVSSLLGNFNNAFIPSLGNLNAEENKTKSSNMFFNVILFYHCMAAFGGISFFLLLNDFISIWLGSEYLMEVFIVFAVSLNFYQNVVLQPMWMFRETMGLFVQIKYVMIVAAVLNIIIAILFAKPFGVAGVALSIVVAKILTLVWYDPKILFKKFNLPVREYWKRQLRYFVLSAVSLAICYKITPFFGVNIFSLVIRGIVYLIITVFVFHIGTIRTTENKNLRFYFYSILVGMIGKS